MSKRINFHTTLQLRTPRVLADAVADVAARQLVTPSEFATQALIDKLACMGVQLRSMPPAHCGDDRQVDHAAARRQTGVAMTRGVATKALRDC